MKFENFPVVPVTLPYPRLKPYANLTISDGNLLEAFIPPTRLLSTSIDIRSSEAAFHAATNSQITIF